MREVVLLKVRLEALGEGGGSRSNTPTCRFQDERSSPLICLKMREMRVAALLTPGVAVAACVAARSSICSPCAPSRTYRSDPSASSFSSKLP